MKSVFPDKPYLSVVMPVFNEEATIGEIVGRVLGVPGLLELVIVDDFSTDATRDKTRALAARHDCITFILHESNQGKRQTSNGPCRDVWRHRYHSGC